MQRTTKIIFAIGLQVFLTKEALSMEKPSTLLELTGAHPKIELDKSVLVMIDYQREYAEGELKLPRLDSVLHESARLLDLARKKHIPVIHVIQQGGKSGIFSGTLGNILQQVQPSPDEPVIVKTLPNAFYGTRLAEMLSRHPARNQLIIAGLMTHMCISATASAALEHGFFSTIITSTTTTRALRGPSEESIDAEIIKASALASLKDRFATIVSDVGSLTNSGR